MIGDVACGSAEVAPTGEGIGFYALVIVSGDTKPGCGVEGAAVRLSLQSGEIDPGIESTQVLFRSGTTAILDLSAMAPLIGGALVGALPAGPGRAYVRWTGPSGVPVEQALRTLSREVESVTFWDVQRQQARHYVVGAQASTQSYTLVDTDDVLMVIVR